MPHGAPFHLDRNPKESISLLSAVFFMGSQCSGHFFRLHCLCRILLPVLSHVKRNNLFNGFCRLSIHFQDLIGDGPLYPTVSLGPASSISCQPSAQHTDLSIMTSPRHFYLLQQTFHFSSSLTLSTVPPFMKVREHVWLFPWSLDFRASVWVFPGVVCTCSDCLQKQRRF